MKFRSALVAATLAFSIVSSPAQAVTSDAGLFGSQDPTYDGVFRQSLALIALKSAHEPVPAAASSWLLNQQCGDGAFQSYRSDLTAACAEFDSNSFLGKDSNSTAIATVALQAIGKQAKAKRGFNWLRKLQNPDGGVGMSKGAASDTASTALTIMAARAVGVDPRSVTVNGRSLYSFIRSSMVGCENLATRGGLAYQPGKTKLADNMTSSQALAALAALPSLSARTTKAAPVLACPNSAPVTTAKTRDAIAGYLARQLRNHNFQLPAAWGGGTDWSSTAWATLGLIGAGRGADVISSTRRTLAANVLAAESDSAGKPAAGKVALLIAVAHATGGKATAFGGRNLIADLKAVMQ